MTKGTRIEAWALAPEYCNNKCRVNCPSSDPSTRSNGY